MIFKCAVNTAGLMIAYSRHSFISRAKSSTLFLLVFANAHPIQSPIFLIKIVMAGLPLTKESGRDKTTNRYKT